MFTLKVLFTVIRLWQLWYKYLDSECCLQIYEEEILEIIIFYQKGYLDFAAQKIGYKTLWYINLLDYNVDRQDVHKLIENILSRTCEAGLYFSKIFWIRSSCMGPVLAPN